MVPLRKKIVRGRKVEEFYWHGEFVVYIDNKLTDRKYNDITEKGEEFPYA